MKKLTQWEKRELLNMYKNTRSKARCILVKKYTDDCKKLTKELDTSIDDLKTQLRTLELIKDKLVDDNDFGNLIPPMYGCETKNEHPTLKKFDIETYAKIQQIIVNK
jgi:hypothetical protein